MDIFLLIIVNDILVLFPILIYHYYVIYNDNLNIKKKEIFLDFAILISLFLTINYINNIPLSYKYIISILPLLLSLINKRKITSIIILTILFEYFISININPIIAIIYLTLIYLLNINNYSNNKYIITSSISLICLYITNKLNIIDILISLIILIYNVQIISMFIKEAKSIINLHTNLKRFEKEKTIKTNLFKITHEVKNPLAVIKGYLDMFDTSDIDKSNKYISIIKNEVDRSLNLLNDFKEFSKITINKDYYSLNKLLDEVKDISTPLFKYKNINSIFNVEENIIAYIDYNRIKQVLLNIIKNSTEASFNNSNIYITAFTSNNNIIIYVKDEGSGISKEYLDKIYEPFFTTKDNGSGLGVSLSREIIMSHGGSISYTSKENKGTTCKIIINNMDNNNLYKPDMV